MRRFHGALSCPRSRARQVSQAKYVCTFKQTTHLPLWPALLCNVRRGGEGRYCRCHGCVCPGRAPAPCPFPPYLVTLHFLHIRVSRHRDEKMLEPKGPWVPLLPRHPPLSITWRGTCRSTQHSKRTRPSHYVMGPPALLQAPKVHTVLAHRGRQAPPVRQTKGTNSWYWSGTIPSSATFRPQCRL